MTIMNLLTVIGIATLINTLMLLFTRNNKKKHEILDKQEDHIISGYNGNVNGYNYKGMSNMNKQIVYKVDGDFVGDIKGDNVTVILMGDGDFVGDIDSKDGEVVLIKGNINGDVKANKVVCPTQPTANDKKQHICKSCYHYVQTPLNGSYCTKNSALGDALPVGCNVCKSYDGTGETTNYKSDCARFSNKSGICHVFHVNTCAIEHNCPYKIKRDECKTDPINNNTTKHNPAKDVESPELPVHLSNYRKNTPEPKMSIIKW